MFKRQSAEDRAHAKTWRETCRKRREQELAVFAEIVRLVKTHGDEEGKISEAAGPLVLTMVKQAQDIRLENEAMGVWDKARKPKWYRNFGMTVNLVEVDEEDDD